MRSLGLVTLALLAPLLAACGSGEDEPGATFTSTPNSSQSTPNRDAVGDVSLRDTCPAVESALPQDMLPAEQSLRDFSDAMFDLYKAGDLETRNALHLFADPVDTYIDVQSQQLTGQPLVEADQSFVAAIQNFADRCAAVGSSALQ